MKGNFETEPSMIEFRGDIRESILFKKFYPISNVNLNGEFEDKEINIIEINFEKEDKQECCTTKSNKCVIF